MTIEPNAFADAMAELEDAPPTGRPKLNKIHYAPFEAYRVYVDAEYIGVIAQPRHNEWWAATSYTANEDKRTRGLTTKGEALAALGIVRKRAATRQPRKESGMTTSTGGRGRKVVYDAQTATAQPTRLWVVEFGNDKERAQAERAAGMITNPVSGKRYNCGFQPQLKSALARYAKEQPGRFTLMDEGAPLPEPVTPEPEPPAKPKRNSNAARDRKRAEAKAAKEAAIA